MRTWHGHDIGTMIFKSFMEEETEFRFHLVFESSNSTAMHHRKLATKLIYQYSVIKGFSSPSIA